MEAAGLTALSFRDVATDSGRPVLDECNRLPVRLGVECARSLGVVGDMCGGLVPGLRASAAAILIVRMWVVARVLVPDGGVSRPVVGCR
jgi:hypothetical protein